jgi:hypothetical protein
MCRRPASVQGHDFTQADIQNSILELLIGQTPSSTELSLFFNFRILKNSMISSPCDEKSQSAKVGKP